MGDDSIVITYSKISAGEIDGATFPSYSALNASCPSYIGEVEIIDWLILKHLVGAKFIFCSLCRL